MGKKFLFLNLFFVSLFGYSQMPKWVLGSSIVNSSGTLNTNTKGQLEFFEINFSGANPTFSQRTLGNSINTISSAGINESMTSATDSSGNISFYVFPNCTVPYSGNTSDTIYLVAYDISTGKDEVFAKINPIGMGTSSAKEIEIVKRDSALNQYYLIYKTTCINNLANDHLYH